MKTKTLLSPILASLFAFVIAAGFGLIMRWAFVLDMPEWFNYKNVQHAHSHVALLGWLFGIFCLSIIHYFGLDFNKYTKLYWSLQLMVVGMLLTFPVMGYASLSIMFSTGHILLAYILAYKLWHDIGPFQKTDVHILFAKTSLLFMVVSTAGTWALGPIMAVGLKGTALYYAAIQFYLHFQFNGWFVFAMIAIALAMMREYNISFGVNKIHRLYRLLVISTILTYALAVTWSTPLFSIFVVNSVGVVLQLVALVVLLRLIFNKRAEIQNAFSGYIYKVFFIALLALSLKIIIQAIVVIPAMAEVSYTVHNFVIGFIHLLMLGCLSLFAFGSITRILQRDLSNSGTWIFLIGVGSTEILLFAQGLMFWQGWGFMPYYYLGIGVCSVFIFLGVAIIVLKMIKTDYDLNRVL